LYNDDHHQFRDSVKTFIAREITPHYLDWEAAGIAPRSLFQAAGTQGLLGIQIPEQYGGGGSNDFRFNAIIAEELAAAGIGGAGLGLTLHNDITTPYFVEYSTLRASRALAARDRQWKSDHGGGDDRARYRIRSGRDPEHCGP
jgi:alkylation response protein AidB-like acyl-CoA dehydrogenase